jgi:hypothetical protein
LEPRPFLFEVLLGLDGLVCLVIQCDRPSLRNMRLACHVYNVTCRLLGFRLCEHAQALLGAVLNEAIALHHHHDGRRSCLCDLLLANLDDQGLVNLVQLVIVYKTVSGLPHIDVGPCPPRGCHCPLS